MKRTKAIRRVLTSFSFIGLTGHILSAYDHQLTQGFTHYWMAHGNAIGSRRYPGAGCLGWPSCFFGLKNVTLSSVKRGTQSSSGVFIKRENKRENVQRSQLRHRIHSQTPRRLLWKARPAGRENSPNQGLSAVTRLAELHQ